MPFPRRRAVIAFTVGAVLGAALLTTLAGWFFFENTQTMLLGGMNGCLPPCPHSTAAYNEDRFTGRRWIAVSTVDENGTPMGSTEIEEPPFRGTIPDLESIALIGAACGGVVGLGVSRIRGERRRSVTRMPVG